MLRVAQESVEERKRDETDWCIFVATRHTSKTLLCHLEIAGRKVLLCFVGNHKEIKEKNFRDFRRQIQFSLICIFPTSH